jgi:uncharacterized membrane protein
MKKLKFLLLQMFRGAIFSFGDIAPGVSGSTMAVILKFYYIKIVEIMRILVYLVI